MKFPSLCSLLLTLTGCYFFSATAADSPERRLSPPLASLSPPAAAGPLRILLVDDDFSDNNHTLGDKRISASDTVFRRLVADAVGGDANAWAVEMVEAYKNGPGIDRLRKYSLIVWYTGSNYGGNPDNSGALSIEDEQTVRSYLEEVGGVVMLISPGYAERALSYNSTWEKSTSPFLSEVMGVRGGVGLAQRFEPGIVTAPDGKQFSVGKGGTPETQFSAVNPDGATVLFTSLLKSHYSTGAPMPVATVHPFGHGRLIYVGYTFENLVETDRAPAFQTLLSASGLQSNNLMAAPRPAPTKVTGSAPEAEPATVQVTGTPTTAVVSWTVQTATITNARIGEAPQTVKNPQSAQAPAQTPTAKVEQRTPNATKALAVASPDALQANDPGPLTPGQAVTYRVTLTDTQGRIGYKEVSFTPPAPRDPESLTATDQIDGSIVLSWPEVPGVVSYQIKVNDNRIAPVIVRNATEWRSARLDSSNRRWTVNSVYEPGGSLTEAANWPSVQSPGLPRPGAPFLSQAAGVGNVTEAAAHYKKQCGSFPLQNCSAENVLLTSRTWQRGTWGEFTLRPAGPGKPFVESDVRTYLTPFFYSVSFADMNDLGRGRRVGCADGGRFDNEPTVVCWATSHGPVPAPGAAVNGTALAQAAEQYADRNNMSLTTIVITSKGAMFGAWVPPQPPWPALPAKADSLGAAFGSREDPWSGEWWGTPKSGTTPDWLKSRNWDVANLAPWQREAIVAAVARPALTIVMDSQGPKSVPHACLSCHGGRYDATTGLVYGASLLPLIPADLTFSSPAVRNKPVAVAPWPDSFQNSEYAIAGINAVIFRSNPSPTIKQRLTALYGGNPSLNVVYRANDLAVPPGWSTQRGLYQQVIAPYCGSCHFAQTGPLSFGSWAEVLQQKQFIQRTVCTDFTMPHSEILFRKFWTEKNGVSLPGLLSTALGFQKCRQ